MTRHRDFKALVRERMDKTGERYTAARAQLLGKASAAPSVQAFPGVLPGYRTFGGIQSGTAALSNTLSSTGAVSSLDGSPFSETLINGLCGGPGFLYAVFEYKGWPPMLSLALRSRSMPDVYIAEGWSRVGMNVKVSETTSPVAARKALDRALDEGQAALCVADAASLPWTGLPLAFVGGGPLVVAVAGRDGDDYWVDDRAAQPRRISGKQLSAARAAYRQAKNRLATFAGPKPKHDAKAALRDAIADTAKRYVEPAVPKSFWVNCGFSGLDKWRQMLVDAKDKRGWPTLFSEWRARVRGPSASARVDRVPVGAPGGPGPLRRLSRRRGANAGGAAACQSRSDLSGSRRVVGVDRRHRRSVRRSSGAQGLRARGRPSRRRGRCNRCCIEVMCRALEGFAGARAGLQAVEERCDGPLRRHCRGRWPHCRSRTGSGGAAERRS